MQATPNIKARCQMYSLYTKQPSTKATSVQWPKRLHLGPYIIADKKFATTKITRY